MVQVFESEEDRQYVHSEMGRLEGYKRTFLSGVTPPTTQIIRRKFMKTRPTKQKSVRFDRNTVAVSVCGLYVVCMHCTAVYCAVPAIL